MESQEQGKNLEDAYIDDEALTSCIRKYPVLYGKSDKDYGIPLEKKNAWKEIGLELAIDCGEAQTRYNTVRTTFSKYLKQQKPVRSGSGVADVPEIKPGYEHLRWLLSYIHHRASSTNFKRKPKAVGPEFQRNSHVDTDTEIYSELYVEDDIDTGHTLDQIEASKFPCKRPRKQ